jgi:hypothetical protein
VTRGKGVRPFGEHVGDLVPVYFAEIISLGEQLLELVYHQQQPTLPLIMPGSRALSVRVPGASRPGAR